MVTSDPRSVGELEERVGEFDSIAPTEMGADDRARLTDALVALADAYGKQGNFETEAETIARLDQLNRATGDGDVDIHLASTLANATDVHNRDDVYETEIEPDRLADYRERIEDLYDRRSEPVIAAPLARATAQTIHAYGKAERPVRIEPLLDRLETIYDTHPEPDIAASLLHAYAHAELYRDTDVDRDTDIDRGAHVDGSDRIQDHLKRAKELFKTHPDGAVAAGLAGVLAGRTNEDATRIDIETIEQRIARIEALAQRYPAHEEAIIRWLPIATANATRASFEMAEHGRIEHWSQETVDYHDRLSTASSATWAAVATFFSARASFFDGDLDAGEAKLEQLEELERRYTNPVFEHWLGRAMFDAARSYVETGHADRARSMADELSEFAVGHQDREEIESGLESLYTHAPQMFDESADESETTGDESSTTGDENSEARDAAEAVDRDENADNSCGDGGCESCGNGDPMDSPAGLPVLAAVGLTVVFVGLSLVYTAYRLTRLVGNTFGRKLVENPFDRP